MTVLVITEGPNTGRQFAIEKPSLLIGRGVDADVQLADPSISRQHAKLEQRDGTYFLVDLGSRNGIVIGGQRVSGSIPLGFGQAFRLGDLVLELRAPSAVPRAEIDPIITEQVGAQAGNRALYERNAVQTLQRVLEIAQDLGSSLDVRPLMERLLGHLLALFPISDRALALRCEQEKLVVVAQRGRGQHAGSDFPFSQTIVRHALRDGVGVLSKDVRADDRFSNSQTIGATGARSLLCVPLIAKGGRRLGVLQLDCSQPGRAFTTEDLKLLTTLGIQVAVVLENVELQADRLREELLRKDLARAREIQEGFLPREFAPPCNGPVELFAHVQPALDMSGDLYDFFPTSDGRLVFLLGDVAGKGMPAALFMVAVRSLSRLLAVKGESPAGMLIQLNDALAADNPAGMFVTVLHGVYDPRTGETDLALGGHPAPLLRRADGQIAEVPMPTGRVLGVFPGGLRLTDTHLLLEPGETLIGYSDGYTEAFAPDGKTMFGLERLKAALSGAAVGLPLNECAGRTSAAVKRFTGSAELQDDQTLFLLRRP